MLHWERESYKGSAKLASWHCLRNSWQALQCLFGFLWCLWCLVFFTLALNWSQGHCFFGISGIAISFLLGALRNQSLQSHSWLPLWGHVLGAWRSSRWPLAIPGFGLLETTGISISGSNRRREGIRIFIATVGAAVCHLKRVWRVPNWRLPKSSLRWWSGL